MATMRSAGIVLFRRRDAGVEVLLGHMGGPFWARKDAGAWSIPKGLPGDDEELEDTARREFQEELGLPVPRGPLIPLGEVTQSGGKRVTAWAVEGDLDPDEIRPGTFELEWPPRSGRLQCFPEIDRAAWFDLDDAHERIVRGQRGLLDHLRDHLGASG